MSGVASYNAPVLILALVMLGGAMALALIRLLFEPTIYGRILALNIFGTLTVLLISLLGFVNGRPDFLDIAILYTLINFVGTFAIVRFLRTRHPDFISPNKNRGKDGMA